MAIESTNILKRRLGHETPMGVFYSPVALMDEEFYRYYERKDSAYEASQAAERFNKKLTDKPYQGGVGVAGINEDGVVPAVSRGAIWIRETWTPRQVVREILKGWTYGQI